MSGTSNPVPLSLAGKTIGLSISVSEDLEALGMNKAVLDLAYVEIARHLLAHGATLAYGGDQRQAGYTEELFDLVRTYNPAGQDVSSRVVNYLAWPLHLNVTDEHRIELLDVATLVEMPLDDTLRDEYGIDEKHFLAPDTAAHQYVWARCLTAMRQRMNKDIDARIVLGGQSSRFAGCYPGIAEETLIALAADDGHSIPVFLLGGFGGCTADLTRIIEHKPADRLTLDYQLHHAEHAATYAEFFTYYNTHCPGEPIDYDALATTIANTGIDGLHNGLDTAENTRLFHTDDIDEVIALMLKGLKTALV